MSTSAQYALAWDAATVQERWAAFRAARAEMPGTTLAVFMRFGPYVRCSWLRSRPAREMLRGAR